MATSRTIRLGTTLSLLACGQLFVATSARAQAAPEVPPPAPVAQPAPPPPPPPSAWGAPAPSPYDANAPRLRQPMMAPRGPVVRMSTDNPAARLQINGFLKWTDVCGAPCGVVVDPGATYRIGGGTVRPSPEFAMPRPAGVVDVEVLQTGSKVKHGVGVGMVIGGIIGLALGGLVLLAASSMSNTDQFGNSNSDAKSLLQLDGATLLVTGAIVTAIGIPLAASSTSVDVR
jgi:hypothetical protein